ncbi:oxalate decarboxylase [Mycena belliarum]|uniref:Oxalate decarboxylase n=1 Tax=Mycena belliarum TaxID=1033014 RepID=A0AAD6XN88_9AGAR|nr:oxalate decarboxylase [Mycena belliae]
MLSVTASLYALYLAALAASAPASGLSSASSALSSPVASGSPTSSAVQATATVPYASTDPNPPLWNLDSGNPQPIRGSYGASVIGPVNLPIEQQNADLFAPPTTDSGSLSNAKWPFSLSHNRLQTGGWARQENIGVMPIATSMASVDMRLEAGAIRELHWHKTSEWAYVLSGSTQVSSVDSEGRNFLATVGPGDLWFFPPGVPHSLQATNDSADGSEFLLIFDDGAFSEDSTFLLTDWLAHVPAEVIQKNFQANSEAFSHIPAKELYIFPGSPPSADATAPSSPQGQVPNSYSFALSQVNATKLPGGSVKIMSTTIAAAEVTVEPGAIRELHWHPTMDEWSFFLEGQGRVTIFASQGNARTFNYQAGDIGFVPTAMGHYVENTGNTTLKYLEIFNADRFQDISLNQWLALTPPELVKAHLQLSDETIASLSKTKNTVVGGQ